jgi:hypothetical protein
LSSFMIYHFFSVGYCSGEQSMVQFPDRTVKQRIELGKKKSALLNSY